MLKNNFVSQMQTTMNCYTF